MDENYEDQLNSAFDQRDSGNGYESGSEDMRRIRNPRREHIGVEKEGEEYRRVKSKRANFKEHTALERFVIKAQEYLIKLEQGEISPTQYVEIMKKKLKTFENKK